MEKNFKRDERRSIIDGLKTHGVNVATFENRDMRRRRPDKAKLERWMKRESASGIPVGSGVEENCLEEHNSEPP
jgi:hypothetical protein